MMKFFALGLAIITCIASSAAFAGAPVDWQLGLQDPASPSALKIYEFHNLLLVIIFAISVFVLALLVYVIFRYNKRANPEPAQFSHNVLIEIIWTVIPVVILIIIAVPSFKVLYYTDRAQEPEMSLKVIGYQWYWGYEYPDHGDISFSSYMIQDGDIDPDKQQVRLLSTDNPVVLPVDTTVQILATGGDVLHSWAMPSLGVKIDTVPGRLNETWLKIKEPGIYFGQCSELCGKDHAFMPIEIRALEKEEFQAWVDFAQNEDPSYYAFRESRKN